MTGAIKTACGLALLATALSAGFFYTYSISVMPGLDAADPMAAIGAMQGINAVIRTPEFAFAFFGALVFPLGAAGLAALGRRRLPALLALLAGLVYAAAVVVVTFLINVPMNEALAAVSAADGSAADIWADYTGPWTLWNHVRMAGAIVAFALMAMAVVAEGRAATAQRIALRPGRMAADAPESR